MCKCQMSKEECLKMHYYDEKYFAYIPDENGYLSIYDKETGEKIKSLKFRKRNKER